MRRGFYSAAPRKPAGIIPAPKVSLREVCGDAALYFPAGDAHALASQLERVLTDPALADELREKGRHRAAELTWNRCASATLDVLRTVALSGGIRR